MLPGQPLWHIRCLKCPRFMDKINVDYAVFNILFIIGIVALA